MPQQYDDLVQVVGVVGQDPKRKQAGDNEIVQFSLAVPRNYGRENDSTKWVDVAVWNEDLQREVLDTVKKGQKIAVEGSVKERQYEGKTYTNFNALRVGHVAWIARNQQAQGKTAAPDPEDF